MKHLAYGVTIAVDFTLDLPLSSGQAAMRVHRLNEPVEESNTTWLVNDEASGWRTGTRHGSYLLGFTDVAAFVVSANGDRIDWWAPDIDDVTLAHLVLDHVVPMALSRAGFVVLHAAVLTDPDGDAFAIAGKSGWGKSTVAVTLTGRGNELWADDCAVVSLTPDGGPPLVAPAYPGVRLHEHSVELSGAVGVSIVGPVTAGGTKLRLAIPTARTWEGAAKRPLVRIFFLDAPGGESTDDEPCSLRPSTALFGLLSHSFHIGAGAERSATLDRLASVVDAVEIVQLRYRRTPDGLKRLVAQIEAWTQGHGSGEGS